jgi:hypothetical protein
VVLVVRQVFQDAVRPLGQGPGAPVDVETARMSRGEMIGALLRVAASQSDQRPSQSNKGEPRLQHVSHTNVAHCSVQGSEA